MILKKGFTLSEIMIAMATLGIIVAACVPIILNMTPNRNAIMIKKAYYTTVQIVNDLVNDQVYYPDEDFSELTAENGPIVGLSYAPDTANGETHTLIPGADANNTTNYLGNEQRRFKCLFASKLNIPINTLISFCKAGTETIDTPDGLRWYFRNCPYGNGDLVNQFNWDNHDVCRIDVAVGSENDGLYSTTDNASICANPGGWGSACNTSSDRLNVINKAAFFISRDGTITLSGTGSGGTGFPDGQPIIQNIINGNIRLLGK